MIFETHAHYEDAQFDADRDELFASMHANGISGVVNVGSTIETSKVSIALAEKYDFVYAAVGVHPSEFECLDEQSLEWLKAQAGHPKVKAIGEIGLDYYWVKEEADREKQRDWFRRQLQVAADTSLPVIIHSRDAAADTLAIMKEAHEKQITGVIHCFSYSAEVAEAFVKMGYFIGIGGVITFKNAKKVQEAVRRIPLEQIVVETDCPYMAPEPYRGKRNSSLYLPYIVQKIAEIKGMREEEVAEVTEKNAGRLYGIF